MMEQPENLYRWTKKERGGAYYYPQYHRVYSCDSKTKKPRASKDICPHAEWDGTGVMHINMIFYIWDINESHTKVSEMHAVSEYFKDLKVNNQMICVVESGNGNVIVEVYLKLKRLPTNDEMRGLYEAMESKIVYLSGEALEEAVATRMARKKDYKYERTTENKKGCCFIPTPQQVHNR